MEAVTEQEAVKTNADRRVVETTQELIALYKREFGEEWKNVFSQVVSVKVEGRS
jgi:hypothetical protein